MAKGMYWNNYYTKECYVDGNIKMFIEYKVAIKRLC